MCSVCLIISAIVILVLGFLTYRIRSYYRWSLTTVQEKSAGLIHFYRSRIGGVFRGEEMGRISIECLAHYILMHCIVPLLYFGFFLRTDINFLGIVIGVAFSLQLLKQVYPGPQVPA
ncbi:MAG: hypothetical protein KDK25_09005 [Leptospiraceae bacterium]|nr:hypothetical protein [Leptospiraceae bacterium]